MLGKRKREAQEEQAEKIMENGNDTIYKCYDELVFKLIGGKQNDDVLTSSPILKKKKKSGLNVTVRGQGIKTYTLEGMRIKSEGANKFKMIDLVKNAKGDGSKILDDETGNLMKKVPCGFYPLCTETFSKDSTVVGGVIIMPPDHRRYGELIYVCDNHEEDAADADEEEKNDNGGSEDLDELETSILDDEMDGEAFMSQSLLKRP